ncbi:MAG: protein-disulfide reductase DsbD family protein, partial [Bacteroidales bacterium]
MKKSLVLILLLLSTISSFAQILDPVKWTFSQKRISDTEVELQYNAKIETGWHLYATELPDGGPIPTTITYSELHGVELTDGLNANKEAVDKYEPLFELHLKWYNDNVILIQKVKIVSPDYKIKGEIRYMGCNDNTCLPPTIKSFEFSGLTT